MCKSKILHFDIVCDDDEGVEQGGGGQSLASGHSSEALLYLRPLLCGDERLLLPFPSRVGPPFFLGSRCMPPAAGAALSLSLEAASVCFSHRVREGERRGGLELEALRATQGERKKPGRGGEVGREREDSRHSYVGGKHEAGR